jgi:hypothetical protein
LGIFITDNVLEIIGFIDGADNYSKPTSIIENISMLREITKKCGFKSNMIPNPNISKQPSDKYIKDAFKR